jgi:hypothetical protein
VFRSTLQGLNQSIAGLLPYLRLLNLLAMISLYDGTCEDYYLINCIVQLMIAIIAYLVMITPTRT